MLIAAFIWQERRAPEPMIPLGLFRSSVFRVATALGFFIGLAMFGAIIFIPLFLQLVYGVSPTSSGLRMLPLMAGLLDGEHPLGPRDHPRRPLQGVPDRRHRDHGFGMFLLSRLEVDTAPWLASVYMLVLGVGIGLVMQVIVLVVQNDAPAATSAWRPRPRRSSARWAARRRRALRGDLRARLATELTALPAAAAARLSGGVNIRPDEVHALPARAAPRVPRRLRRLAATGLPRRRRRSPRSRSCSRWLLKEVPLRTTTKAASADPVTAAAPAAR